MTGVLAALVGCAPDGGRAGWGGAELVPNPADPSLSAALVVLAERDATVAAEIDGPRGLERSPAVAVAAGEEALIPVLGLEPGALARVRPVWTAEGAEEPGPWSTLRLAPLPDGWPLGGPHRRGRRSARTRCCAPTARSPTTESSGRASIGTEPRGRSSWPSPESSSAPSRIWRRAGTSR